MSKREDTYNMRRLSAEPCVPSLFKLLNVVATEERKEV